MRIIYPGDETCQTCQGQVNFLNSFSTDTQCLVNTIHAAHQLSSSLFGTKHTPVHVRYVLFFRRENMIATCSLAILKFSSRNVGGRRLEETSITNGFIRIPISSQNHVPANLQVLGTTSQFSYCHRLSKHKWLMFCFSAQHTPPSSNMLFPLSKKRECQTWTSSNSIFDLLRRDSILQKKGSDRERALQTSTPPIHFIFSNGPMNKYASL